jgi:lipopolysaccharide assembly protein B
MLDLSLLLLPVAAASGWYAAKRHTRSDAARTTRGLSSDYFKGLNYVLNEQPDKAIEVFVRMLEVDSETVEMHLALGNLFRRRGETDRSIRIHQSLIARTTLSSEQRTLALLELGQDYMRAGLLDRAESLFLELVDLGAHRAASVRHLVDIYQQEKDWGKAIAAVHQLEQTTGKPMHSVIAQYYCELAELARDDGRPEEASELANKALVSDRCCVRASLLLGDMAMDRGEDRAAVEAYKQVESQDPAYLPEVIEPLLKCYARMDNAAEMIAYLQHVLERHGGISIMLALAEQIRGSRGDRDAGAFITEQLRRRPSVRGLHRLIELNLAHTEGRARDNLLILKDLTSKLLKGKPVYKCTLCGFPARSLHWQCPGCKSWKSVKPVQGVEGE